MELNIQSKGIACGGVVWVSSAQEDFRHQVKTQNSYFNRVLYKSFIAIMRHIFSIDGCLQYKKHTKGSDYVHVGVQYGKCLCHVILSLFIHVKATMAQCQGNKRTSECNKYPIMSQDFDIRPLAASKKENLHSYPGPFQT